MYQISKRNINNKYLKWCGYFLLETKPRFLFNFILLKKKRGKIRKTVIFDRICFYLCFLNTFLSVY